MRDFWGLYFIFSLSHLPFRESLCALTLPSVACPIDFFFFFKKHLRFCSLVCCCDHVLAAECSRLVFSSPARLGFQPGEHSSAMWCYQAATETQTHPSSQCHHKSPGRRADAGWSVHLECFFLGSAVVLGSVTNWTRHKLPSCVFSLHLRQTQTRTLNSVLWVFAAVSLLTTRLLISRKKCSGLKAEGAFRGAAGDGVVDWWV